MGWKKTVKKFLEKMGIVCPNCGSTKVESINSIHGKMCRCKNCGHLWYCLKNIMKQDPLKKG